MIEKIINLTNKKNMDTGFKYNRRKRKAATPDRIGWKRVVSGPRSAGSNKASLNGYRA